MIKKKDVLLGDLEKALVEVRLSNKEAAQTAVFGVSQDSRTVSKGDLFVARAGERSDGTKFIAQAKDRGAVAVLVESNAATSIAASIEGLPVLTADDLARTIGPVAHRVYGHPTRALDVIGITGTNGKTTTTYLVRAAIDAALGREVTGIIGTVGHSYRDVAFDAAHTTPEADTLARLFRTMKDEGASFVAMEVSSIALAKERTRGIEFSVAAFTNLTQDHLDFHGTMEAYEAEKTRLFVEYVPRHSVIHTGDPAGSRIAALLEKRGKNVIRVSAKNDPTNDIFIRAASFSEKGIVASIATKQGEAFELRSPLTGLHNLENLVVTLGIVRALGLDMAKALEGLSTTNGAPGRLERVTVPGADVTVLVDYAHTPDALERVLASARPFTKGRLFCVFGCGGDRDPTKREPMGRAAAAGSDIAIVTSDNPRSEDPLAIVAVVAGAVHGSGRKPIHPGDAMNAENGYLVIPDRREAIEIAIASANPGDLVLVAGKGHETYQIMGDEKLHFDDREEARNALQKRHETKSTA